MKLNTGNTEMAVFRYGIICSVLHRTPDDGTLEEILYRLSLRPYKHPNGSSLTFRPETLRKWLYRYRHGGLPALESRCRSDKGSCSISEHLSDVIFRLRQEHPRWTVTQILDRLIKENIWNGRRPSRSTLYRFAKKHQLNRDPHLNITVKTRAFEFHQFGQLWMADFLHGPRLRVGNKRKKTYLHAILDDSTRYIVSGGFYLAENVETLMQDIRIAVRRFGLPQRFYTDNGASYSSRHLKFVCARLGMQLVHTPPYRPQGRGKVERFFRTVREQFLNVKKYSTLEQINESFNTWVRGYHSHRHSSLASSPLQKRLSVETVCRPLPEVANIDPLFMMERRCRVYLDGCIRLKKQLYEVPDVLPGSRVTIHYTPWDLTQVYYGKDYTPAKIQNKSFNARRFEHP